MRWLTPSLLLLALAGCQSCDRVESELRVRENELREVRGELLHTQAYNNALQNELRGLRGEFAIGPDGLPAPVAVYPICSLTLGRQTGGRDGDTLSGDIALQVVLEPRDVDGQ